MRCHNGDSDSVIVIVMAIVIAAVRMISRMVIMKMGVMVIKKRSKLP